MYSVCLLVPWTVKSLLCLCFWRCSFIRLWTENDSLRVVCDGFDMKQQRHALILAFFFVNFGSWLG
jgi:hypothetical protein